MAFLEDLLEVAKGIKVAAGPKSQINQLSGVSYNSLMAPIIEREEQEKLTDLLIDMNEQQGNDMSAFRMYREDGKKNKRPPSAPVMKLLGEMALRGYEERQKTVGRQTAERLVPGETTGAPLEPNRQGPPEQPRLTPQQEALRGIIAKSPPSAILKDYPTIMEYAQSTPQKMSAKKQELLDSLFAAHPDLDATDRQLLRAQSEDLFYTPEGRARVAQMARQYAQDAWTRKRQLEHDARQANQEQRQEQRYTTEQQRYQDTVARQERRETTEQKRYDAAQEQRRAQEQQQVVQRYEQSIVGSNLSGTQKSAWIKRLHETTTPQDAQRVFEQAVSVLPTDKPIDKSTLQQKIRENSYNLTMFSRYMQGQVSGDQLAALPQDPTMPLLDPRLLTGAGGGRTPPNSAAVDQHIRLLLGHHRQLISAMQAIDPVEALAYTQQLEQLLQVLLPGESSSSGVAPAATTGASQGSIALDAAKFKTDFSAALGEQLRVNKYTTLPPPNHPLHQSILNTVFREMVTRGYDPERVKTRMQEAIPTWQPPASAPPTP